MNAPQENGQQVLFRRDGKQVYVLGHQAIGQHCDVRKNQLLAQEIKLDQTIGFHPKHKLARWSARSDVVGHPGAQRIEQRGILKMQCRGRGRISVENPAGTAHAVPCSLREEATFRKSVLKLRKPFLFTL